MRSARAEVAPCAQLHEDRKRSMVTSSLDTKRNSPEQRTSERRRKLALNMALVMQCLTRSRSTDERGGWGEWADLQGDVRRSAACLCS
jgi:hypothetical protein